MSIYLSLSFSGEFRGVLARKADAFGYPFQLTHFSLPISLPVTPHNPSTQTLDVLDER